MKTRKIGAAEALVIAALADLGVDDDKLCELTGLHPLELHSMVNARNEVEALNRGRIMALTVENTRLFRRVRALEITLKRAGLELPAE